MTRAEVLAEYLGLNEKARPELYTASHTCGHCKAVVLSRSYSCQNCGGGASRFVATYTLALPDPLAPGTAADAWGPPIDRWLLRQPFTWTMVVSLGRFGVASPHTNAEFIFDESPVRARVRAIMAADPAFREKMEGAEG